MHKIFSRSKGRSNQNLTDKSKRTITIYLNTSLTFLLVISHLLLLNNQIYFFKHSKLGVSKLMKTLMFLCWVDIGHGDSTNYFFGSQPFSPSRMN